MEKSLVIIFIGSLFFLAHAFVLLFEKTKVPDILYLIIIGLIIGPVLQLTQPEDFGKVGPLFSTIALVVILFEGGLELNIEAMRESLGETFKLIIATYFSTTLLLGSFFFFALNYDLLTASFIAAVVAGPAPVVVLPLLKQLKPSDKIKTTLTIESGLGEALAIMVSLAIFESIKMKDINGGKMIGNIISSFILAAGIGLVAGYFWSIVLNKIRQLRNAIFTTPSFVFVIYGLCEFLGFSGPIGVLVFGATLCNTGLFNVPIISKRIKILPIGHNETEKLFFGEIVFVLKTFFFVYLGLSISFQNIFYISIAAITIVIIFGARYISVKLLYAGRQYSKRDLSIVWLMISKGLAAAVLGSLLYEHGIERGGEIRSIIYYIILLSIIANSFLIFISQRRNTVEEKK
ncbi:MAG: hypothetical protein CVV24_12790 [Ignavibacteriae bacterium HGW-Ignavibacteriae-3]|nr:MAG: hypothetical protein CVV24_12790 [Ignavibacteriae bacterium HGW-Ignavibacteriae-3]